MARGRAGLKTRLSAPDKTLTPTECVLMYNYCWVNVLGFLSATRSYDA
jgi:hypothetical protein